MALFKLISTIFLQEKYISKINTKETKPKQSQWTQTVENIRYEPILSYLLLRIGTYNARKLELKK